MKLRRADATDALDLLAWRNDAATRAVSRADAVIEAEAHLRWFARAVADPGRLLLIGEDAEGKLGMVRFDRAEDRTEDRAGDRAAGACWVASVNVAPARRGHGHGFALLHGGLRHLIDQAAPVTVTAEIKAGNQASRRIFERCGFEFRGSDQGFDQMTLSVAAFR
jgi:RimJ/RimL family protein N-acetyltransferase